MQRRKRKTPARGRQRKPKTKTNQNQVSLHLLNSPSSEDEAISAPEILRSEMSSFDIYHAPSEIPENVGSVTDFGKTECEEIFDDANVRCVAPLDVGSGIRNYTCCFQKFTRLDGPNSVKEHIRLFHPNMNTYK